MKVVMVTHDRKIDRRIIQEAKTLIHIGYDVTIIAFPWDGEEDKDLGAIKVKRLTGGSEEKNAFAFIKAFYYLFRKQLFSHPRLMFKLRNILNGYIIDIQKYFENYLLQLAIEENGDVYHAHDLPSLSSSYKAAKLNNALLVYDSHEIYCEQGYGKAETKRWRQVEADLIANADAVITINESAANYLKQKYKCKAPIVLMNKSEAIKNNTCEEKVIHKKLGISEVKPILLYQGGIVASRNLDKLVLAMRDVESDVVLVLLGEGLFKRDLLKLVKRHNLVNRVFFIDEVPQGELLKYTQSADIGVIPYLGDCLNNYYCTPNKLFEFIAGNIPILASSLPEVNKVVEGEGIGITTDFSNTNNIAEAIDRMINDKVAYSAYKRNLADIMQKYSWDYEGNKLIDLYSTLRKR